MKFNLAISPFTIWRSAFGLLLSIAALAAMPSKATAQPMPPALRSVLVDVLARRLFHRLADAGLLTTVKPAGSGAPAREPNTQDQEENSGGIDGAPRAPDD